MKTTWRAGLVAGVLLGSLACAGGRAFAQTAVPGDSARDRYVVELLTMGPGDDLVALFGHDALRVRDRRLGTDRVFNYGTFYFDADTPMEFVRGRLSYWLSVSGFEDTLELYHSSDRSVTGQSLRLPPGQAARLVRFLEWNVLPENSAYRYHLWNDNCVTRLRDVIDRFTGGSLREVTRGRGATGRSFRQLGYDHLGPSLPIVGLLDVFANARIDERPTRWRLLFLPQQLHDAVGRARVSIGARRLPLVSASRVYLRREAPVVMHPPTLRPTWIVLGAPALLLALAAASLARPRVAAMLRGAGLAIFGLIAGLAGVASVLFWVFTDHAELGWNANLLQLAPTDLLLVVLGPLARDARPRLATFVMRYLFVRMLVSGLGVVALLARIWPQDTAPVAIPAFVALLAGSLAAGHVVQRIRAALTPP